MNAKHTPTLALPLRASTTHSCEVHIFDRNDEKVASIISYTGDLTSAQLDHADFIVNACNSHDALVAALDLCIAELSAYDAPRDPLNPHNVALDAARVALKGMAND